jgi:GT2 family glycosyltransferase
VSGPRLSIVVPTFNRRALLARTLPALLAQRGVADGYEAIVVVDGSTDGTLDLLRGVADRRLRVVAQPNRGLAAARNRGAGEARGGIVLFLDDDMIADPGLAAAHLEAHADGREAVALGALAVAGGGRRSFLQEGVEAWSRDLGRRLAAPGYRARFDDWSFGHASISRSLFLRAGGFDEEFVAYGNEDYDLGFRLGRMGVEVRFAAGAVARQIYDKNVLQWLGDMTSVGRADVALVRKHPELAAGLRLAGGPVHPLKRLARWSGGAPADPLAPLWGGLALALAAADAAGLRGRFLAHAQSLAGERAYWRGVRAARGPAPAAPRGGTRPAGRAA